MKKLLIFGFLVFECVVLTAQTSIDVEMRKLVNYRKMTEKNKQTFTRQRTQQTAKWKENNIPENFRVPIELISFRNAGTRCYSLYNVKYGQGIGYVPSDLVSLYEQEAWRAYQKYGVNAPSLSIVLAQQYTESAFNPQVKGDNGLSIGLPQLYRKTAKLLYKLGKEEWDDFFAFNKRGEHYFFSNRMQVRFPFEFLPKVKGYDAENKLDGLRRYNGYGEAAFAYAEKVISRSLIYEELFAKYNAIPIDTANFRDNLFGMINLTLICHDLPELPIDSLNQMFKNILMCMDDGVVRKAYTERYFANVMESEPLSINTKVEFVVPASGHDFYLEIEDGRTVYSYFADNNQLLATINNPQNSEFYLYIKKDGKIVKLSSYKGVGKKTIFSNVKPGDKIFIPPGTMLKSPGTNLSVIVR